MSKRLITAALAFAVLSSSAAVAQPFPGGRGPGPGPGNVGQQGGPGCFPGERAADCGQRRQYEQRSQRHYVYRDGRYESQDSTGAAVAGGILGFILGAAIAGSNNDRAYYDAHRNDNGWRARCRATYRSFDWRTGTYLGRDGYRHYCVR